MKDLRVHITAAYVMAWHYCNHQQITWYGYSQSWITKRTLFEIGKRLLSSLYDLSFIFRYFLWHAGRVNTFWMLSLLQMSIWAFRLLRGVRLRVRAKVIVNLPSQNFRAVWTMRFAAYAGVSPYESSCSFRSEIRWTNHVLILDLDSPCCFGHHSRLSWTPKLLFGCGLSISKQCVFDGKQESGY